MLRRLRVGALLIASVLMHVAVFAFLSFAKPREIAYVPAYPSFSVTLIDARTRDFDGRQRRVPSAAALSRPDAPAAAELPASSSLRMPSPARRGSESLAFPASPATDVAGWRPDPAWRVSPATSLLSSPPRSWAQADCNSFPIGSANLPRHCTETAAMSRPISGSGDSRRDARFARRGERQLAEYAERRQPLAGAVRSTCDKSGPIADCGVEVKVELFSSVDGWLPGLRRRED